LLSDESTNLPGTDPWQVVRSGMRPATLVDTAHWQLCGKFVRYPNDLVETMIDRPQR
jgi:hypothetical protein